MGLGRAVGQVKSSERLATLNDAIAPTPPVENVMSAAAAMGRTPSSVRTSVVSIGVHPDGDVESGMRTGPEAMSLENVPSGFAHVSPVEEVSVSTSTGCPLFAACVSARFGVSGALNSVVDDDAE